MLCASEWVAVAWSKVSFAFSVFVMLWEGRSIQVGWPPILCVLYVDPAESHCVGGATYRPASRDRYPIPSHTRVGDRKPNLATSQLYDWAKTFNEESFKNELNRELTLIDLNNAELADFEDIYFHPFLGSFIFIFKL